MLLVAILMAAATQVKLAPVQRLITLATTMTMTNMAPDSVICFTDRNAAIAHGDTSYHPGRFLHGPDEK